MFMAALVVCFACNKNDNTTTVNNIHTISATLNSAQENPAGTSTATGALTGTYDTSTKTLTYNLSWNGLSGNATGAHFHGPASTTTNANILIPITISNNAPTASASGSVVIADSVAAFLSKGQVYVNVHTAAKPGGEIRGQVIYQ